MIWRVLGWLITVTLAFLWLTAFVWLWLKVRYG